MDAIEQDPQVRAKVLYHFIVIGEAATRLRDIASVLAPDEDWSGVRGFGNAAKHDYERMDRSVLSNLLRTDKLEELRKSCELAIQKIVHHRL